MYPSTFEYHRPTTLDEALGLLARYGEEAKVLAGGQSLLPAMKMRLAEPTALIDLGALGELRAIQEAAAGFTLGAMTTHYAIESSAALRAGCPLLPELAAQIGDVQVRNRGTIGGSLVHADPAADWPAALLALEGEMEIVGPNGARVVAASTFFVDLLQSAVESGEILRSVRVPKTSAAVAYVKTRQKASGFALAGVAAIIGNDNAVRVGVTGVAAVPYRAAAVEAALQGQTLTEAAMQNAAQHAADDVEALEDMHASADYRAHLACVNTARALSTALRRRG
jgi:carbon-monoxide dehydrogenase medium subunit